MRIPIGIDDFRVLREQGLAYVDKSSLIQELLDEPGVQVVHLPRPRRFDGKRVWVRAAEKDARRTRKARRGGAKRSVAVKGSRRGRSRS